MRVCGVLHPDGLVYQVKQESGRGYFIVLHEDKHIKRPRRSCGGGGGGV